MTEISPAKEANIELARLARSVRIEDYLEEKGVDVKKRGDRYICLSPFTEESNPSFYIYPENAFYCFSTGTGGDVITLVMLLEDIKFIDAIKLLSNFSSNHKIETNAYVKGLPKIWKRRYGKFTLSSYVIDESNDMFCEIEHYANKRGFLDGSYLPSKFLRREDGGELHERFGVGFPLTDYFGSVCGIKIRTIHDEFPRFNQRGNTGFYVIENYTKAGTDFEFDPVVYVVESETSASCFAKYARENNIHCVIISFGGISQIPECLPFKYDYLTKRYLIIDYDGDEIKWAARSEEFKHLKAKDIRIPTDKGIDLATLSKSGDIKRYL